MISAGGMAQLGEWSMFNNQGHAFLRADSFSLGCIMISAGGMVQAQKSRTVNLLCLRRIVQIAHGWCFTFWGQMLFQISQYASGRMAQMTHSLYHDIVMQVDIGWYDYYGDFMSLDSSYMALWWMCSTGLTMCHRLNSRVLLGVVMYHWIVVLYYYG